MQAMRTWLLALLAAVACPTALAHAEKPSAFKLIADPGDAVTWRPCVKQKASHRYYPEAAGRARIEGAATVACRLSAKGKPAACAALDETSAGMNFGQAATELGCILPLPRSVAKEAAATGTIPSTPIRFKLPD
jgi:hypothetical protein